MNSVFLLRLVLDSVAAGLLLFAFAYFWQGNASHEWAGIGMFAVLIVHNAFHRRWFASLTQVPRAKRGKFNVALTLVLLVGMLALLGTSLVISETLFAGLRLDDDFTLRRVHAGIAYWLLIVVFIHLGLRWPLLMAVARKLFGFQESNAARTAILRLVAAGIALQGVFSALALNLPARLLFQISLDWWNFEESVAAFFLHCMAIAGLCMFLTHYSMLWAQRRMRRDAM
ncbi:hypothetical protein HNP48_000140 [Acidovorax soli]|uniref:Flavinylation-associated cytochrome domain-containing protein n=1 Tax=Acidovorax soli TaxID=592050 RepID=A0A7X0U6Y0_9BURK|nr:DUF4405 domain-containing protein [Acidovorax soli]MBB6557476.1 hypothetical protein [Acidovorax soli]